MDPEKRDFMVHWLTKWVEGVEGADAYQEAHFSELRSAADLIIEYTPRALAIVRTELPAVDSLYSTRGGQLNLEEGRLAVVTVRGQITVEGAYRALPWRHGAKAKCRFAPPPSLECCTSILE